MNGMRFISIRHRPLFALPSSAGFTMIELLCVILLIGVLASAAIPQFLDFRKEAKAAALQQTLASMRTAIKLQTAQIKLRCNAPTDAWPAGYAVFGNDIVAGTNDWYSPTLGYGSCPTSIGAGDRKFLDVSIAGGFSVGVRNPFGTGAPPEYPTGYVCSGGKCNCDDVPFLYVSDWYYFESTGEFIPGTNTPGIHECDF